MTDQAIETLLYFLSKVYVPGTQQDEFLWAVEQLKALQNKVNRAA
jgi:hypothetical protein